MLGRRERSDIAHTTTATFPHEARPDALLMIAASVFDARGAALLRADLRTDSLMVRRDYGSPVRI